MQNIQSRYSRSLNLQVIDHLLLLAGSSTANKQLARSETRPVDYNNVKQRTATCKLNVEHIEPIVVETCISAKAWAVRTLCVTTFVVTNSKSGNFIICSTFGSVAFTGSKNVRRFNALYVPLSEFHWPTASELQSDCNRRSQVIACDLKERNEREVISQFAGAADSGVILAKINWSWPLWPLTNHRASRLRWKFCKTPLLVNRPKYSGIRSPASEMTYFKWFTSFIRTDQDQLKYNS